MNELKHSGTPQNFAGDPHGSGRYREGSGERPYQHGAMPFLEEVKALKKAGMTEKEVAEAMGLSSSTQLRAKISIEGQKQRAAEQSQALRLKEHGYSIPEISKIMGIPERTVYTRLDPILQDRSSRTEKLAEELKKQVDDKIYLDVGVGVEYQLGVNNNQLKTAVAMLEEQGYKKHLLKVEQATNPGKKTTVTVLTKDDIETRDVYANRDKVRSPLGVYSDDNGHTFRNIQTPLDISADRVMVRFAEDGGKDRDGLIELRRGVEDLSLGQNHYAQVRISVEGTHYLKGMAVYNDKMPKGVDVIFNTNKSKFDVDKFGAMKSMKDDPDNPFGSTVRQLTKGTGKFDSNGDEIRKVYSACNIVNDDTDWAKWSNSLSSQFLSKQNHELAKRQLDIAYKFKKQEFDDICKLTNPAVKKSLLLSFSEECDSDASHLKAASMPRQHTQVLLPIPSLKDHEVYAPNFKQGEEIILVRHPHGGTFEIPRLKVNNRNPEAKELIGPNSKFAIGINKHVADRLSGADFDGDTVIAIPIRNQKMKISPALDGLKNFDPQERYKAYPGMPKVSEKTGFRKQLEMGKVSNLITDMTLKGASQDEIAKAVRHSMVIIDAEKHNLNYKQSYEDNQIAMLKQKYQGGKNKGASTIISKANSEFDTPMRKEWLPVKFTSKLGQGIDPKTGRKIYKETGETWTDKKGKVHIRQEKITKMDSVDDAYRLTSGGSKSNPGTKMEGIYAEHANKLKALGNAARKEYISTPNQKYNPSAKKTYAAEVASLDRKLKASILNAPRERQAQLLADYIYKEKKKNTPDLSKEDIKKLKSQTLDEARNRVKAVSRKQRNIDITDREWEAIQAGAISNNKLTQILKNSDEKAIKERATPKNRPSMTPAKIARAKSLLRMGYTQSEIADFMGVSVSTINKQVNE